MQLVGFRKVKAAVIAALKAGKYQHEARANIVTKNLLATGTISVDEVLSLLQKSNGLQYSTSPHHADDMIDVHLLKTGGWYIKFYFIDSDTMFISVHQ